MYFGLGNEKSKLMKIGIAGCGITGTAAACFLLEQGHEVTLFEQADECGPIGAGILLQPSGQEVLKRLGLFDEIEARSAKLDGLEARLASGRQLVRLRYGKYDRRLFGLGVHRGLLFQLLLAQCRSRAAEIRLSSRVVGFRQDGDGSQLLLEGDEETEAFDFLIAADGSRSQLRSVSGIRFREHEYDYAALWMTGPLEAIEDRLYQVIDGTRRLVGLLPIGDGQASFFWGLRADEYEALAASPFEQWQAEVVGLCPHAEELLATIDSFDQLIFTRYRHVVMPCWSNESIVFLGDAAHPTSPHLGQGVNLALEDAACFTDALADCEDFSAACDRFTQQRRAKLRYYQTVTRMLTPFFQSGSSVLAFGRDVALPLMPRLPVVGPMMVRTLCGVKRGWFR